MEQGIVHVCATTPLQLTVEHLVKVTQRVSEPVLFVIVQVSQIFTFSVEITIDGI